MKHLNVLVTVVVALAFIFPQPALATEYSPADPGYFTGARVFLDGSWQQRPGLDSQPVTSEMGPYTLHWDLASGAPIASFAVRYGIQDVGWFDAESSSDGTTVTATIPALDPAWFNPCQQDLRVSFYLQAYDEFGNVVENDERHYAAEEGGDPYFFLVLNPAPNQPPSANPGGPYSGFSQDDISLDASASSDPEGQPLTYAWDVFATWNDWFGSEWFMDGEYDNGDTATLTVNFMDAGRYHAKILVTDACGESAEAETNIDVFNPHMVVQPQYDQVNALYFLPGSTLTLWIDGVEMGTATANFQDDLTLYGYSWMLGEQGFDVQPGQEVIIWGDQETSTLGDEIVKQHTVSDLTIDGANFDLDQTYGTGTPGTEIRARVDAPYWTQANTIVGEDGTWVAQFDVDLQEGMFLSAHQSNTYDASHTLVDIQDQNPQPQPVFAVQPRHGWAQARNWPIGNTITLVIDDDADNANGVLYSASQTVVPADWDPSTGMAFFDLGEQRPLLADGNQLRLSDGETEKSLTIAPLELNPVNVGLSIVSGNGPANANAVVMVQTPDRQQNYEIVIGANGSFSLDLSGEGFDLSQIVDHVVEVYDGDGDSELEHLLDSELVASSITPAITTPNTPITISASFLGYLFQDIPNFDRMVINILGYQEGIEATLDGNYPVTTGSINVRIPTPGVYPVDAQVSDSMGGANQQFLGFLVVYDPLGGFVTGGGTINSPAGAYMPDPTLEGKANFGFVSKYKDKIINPVGETEFQLQAGNLSFHSSTYEWMVISGSKVTLKGRGMLNNTEPYEFMIMATDGNVKGGDGIDRIRVFIYRVVDGQWEVLYDNQPGDFLEAPPQQPLLGGSIVIHR